ncbi:MAG: UvrD-helicase domain-containing protein, partial [Acidimicrobiales bacterium]|nr:UvrD-helicase domain-containing protein [Acidimicrobiales bacterium]
MTSTSFELHGPLPRGRLAIEASAGTGKTFTLATLAARYIAEQGVSVGELLIVTFTRAAAAELKDRVRARLVEFQSLLETDQLTDSQAKDKVASQLWDTSPALRAQRLGFVDAALSEFDT